ncbi:hypothetical protein D5086_021510 [Populus alba]|uniref:Uncharacterized protein n=1 Tax=Populus alba TaxID=43335 RepID=A0ACC4BCY3_POPAL
MLSSWHSGSGTLSANAYEFFRYKAAPIQWDIVGKARFQLEIHSRMSTLNRAIRGLNNNKKRFGTANEKSLTCSACVLDLGRKKQMNFQQHC